MLRDERKDLRHFNPALTMPFELKWGGHQRAGIALADDNITLSCEWLSGVFRESRFVIPRVYLARPARHEKGNYRFGARLKMRLL